MLLIGRKLIACILAFDLVMLLLFGFGRIYQDSIMKQLGIADVEVMVENDSVCSDRDARRSC